MKKFFYFVISISILIVAISTSYYYVIYLPQRYEKKEIIDEEKNILQNNIKCQEDGMKLAEKERKENPSLQYTEPKFKFNQKLNTCLYKGSYYNEDYTFTWFFIKDVYTNEELALFCPQLENLPIGDKKFWDLKRITLFPDN